MPRRPAAAVAAGLCLWLVFPDANLWWLAPVGVALLAGATLTAGARRGALLGLLAGLAFFVPVLSWSGVYVGALPWFALATLEALYVAAMSAVVGYAGRRLTAAGRTGTAYLRRAPRLGGAGVGPRSHPLRRFPLGAAGVQPGRQPAGPRRSLARGTGRDVRRGGRRHAAARRGHLGRAPVAGRRAAVAAVRRRRARRDRPAGHRPADRRPRRVGRRSCRATCRRPAWTSTPSVGPCSTTTSGGTEQLAARAPDDLSLVVWPENSSDIDPFRNADAAAQIDPPAEAVGVPLLVGAVLVEPPDRSVERLAVLPARGRRAPALRQAAPGAVRRVHPEPGVLPDVQRRRPTSRATSSPATRSASSGCRRPGGGLRGAADDLLRGGLRRPDARQRPSRRRRPEPARRADQQRDLRLHRRVRAAVRHLPDPGHRARPVGRARLDGRGVAASSPPTARSPRRPPCSPADQRVAGPVVRTERTPADRLGAAPGVGRRGRPGRCSSSGAPGPPGALGFTTPYRPTHHEDPTP